MNDLWEVTRKPPFNAAPINANSFSNLPIHPRSRESSRGFVSEVDSTSPWYYGNASMGIPIARGGQAASFPYSPYEASATPRERLGSTLSDPSDFGSMSLEQNAQATVRHLMSTLSQRGSGRYTCPYAENCTKGGVAANRALAVFERNSAFR